MSISDPTRIDLATDPLTQRFKGVAMHGNVHFDVPYVSEIANNLWQGGCADGLVLPSHIKHLISLYPAEHYTVPKPGIVSLLTVSMYDSLDQTFEQVDAIAAWVNACAGDGPTLVHCQAGLNRSGLVAARALMLRGLTARHAIRVLRAKRSPAVLCNQSFERWLLDLDDL